MCLLIVSIGPKHQSLRLVNARAASLPSSRPDCAPCRSVRIGIGVAAVLNPTRSIRRDRKNTEVNTVGEFDANAGSAGVAPHQFLVRVVAYAY